MKIEQARYVNGNPSSWGGHQLNTSGGVYGGRPTPFLRVACRWALAVLVATASVFCTGCAGARSTASKAWSAYDAKYERSLTVETGSDGQPKAGITIKSRPPATLTEAQVADIMARLAVYARQDSKKVVPLEAAR